LKYLLKVKRIGIIFFLEGIEIMTLESCGRPYIYTHSTGIDAYVGDIRINVFPNCLDGISNFQFDKIRQLPLPLEWTTC
jgi:hypothetical protein